MTQLKVHGETYDSPEDALAAADELAAQLENLPESHPGRPDVQRHIERLRTAASGEQPQADSSPESAVSPESEPTSLVATDEAPSPGTDDEEEETEDEEGIPPGYHRCPVCIGRGVLPIEPPEDPRTIECRRCQGFGQVLTGSKVEGHLSRDCPDCNGQGWVDRPATYEAQNGGTAIAKPIWEGSRWNESLKQWEPPLNVSVPWQGATWDALQGTYR